MSENESGKARLYNEDLEKVSGGNGKRSDPWGHIKFRCSGCSGTLFCENPDGTNAAHKFSHGCGRTYTVFFMTGQIFDQYGNGVSEVQWSD